MRKSNLTAGSAVFFIVCLLLSPRPARAADVSTYSFAGCAFPDTNQSVSYTATFGEDHDYASSISTMSFTIYNPVGISSVTVDNRTGLMWVTTPLTDAGFKGTQTWVSALTSCTVTLNGMAYAGYTDWRLPNVRELMSIVDYGAASVPRINTTAFPGTVSDFYWTSTTYVPNSTIAWHVYFNAGYVGNSAKTNSLYVRCVRGGP
ncbi:MAG: hypothetical protein A2049_00985 [Elusimicrobia bacterium GWA2_62_23]|nr:MAG: hypothetical protein A2049_00985 [Elusimicrobia bacterium GWA2_62_23]